MLDVSRASKNALDAPFATAPVSKMIFTVSKMIFTINKMIFTVSKMIFLSEMRENTEGGVYFLESGSVGY